MIEIQQLSYAYDEHLVLNELSIALETNKAHGIVGLNGAGKSTLMNCFNQTLTPQKGKILYQKEVLKTEDLFLLETRQYFYPYINGAEYLALFPCPPNKTFDVKTWAELLQLPLDQLIDEYSTGMKKKLGILAAIKTNKPILLLDEPYNGLDLEAVHVLNKVINLLKIKGNTILLTSHIFSTLKDNCDCIHLLKNGKFESSWVKEDFHLLENQLTEHFNDGLDNKLENLLRF